MRTKLLAILLCIAPISKAEELVPIEPVSQCVILINITESDSREQFLINTAERTGQIYKLSYPRREHIATKKNVSPEILQSTYLAARKLILTSRKKLNLQSTEKRNPQMNHDTAMVSLMMMAPDGQFTVSVDIDKSLAEEYKLIQKLTENLKSIITQ
jgi:hypothetical protein